MVKVEILSGPLAPDRALGLPSRSDGAVVEFQGVVRDVEDGTRIAAIDYECHVAMALTQLTRIAGEVAAFYALTDFTVLHRIGVVPAGEASLYVRAVAAHRREAFAAALEVIERLKRDVPIWKHPR
jgi:molybdopterin synthase catalytic subunit